MDISETLVPNSAQLNAEDLLTGPRTVTITDVKRGTAEQPVDIVTEEFGLGRPYKPSKTMRRVLVHAWGPDASTYIGRRITIYRDPDITFGRDKVGGIRISALSDIDKPLQIALTVTRGRRATFAVEPLQEASPNRRALMTQAAVGEFEGRIAAANSIRELDRVALDLKTWELGAHRDQLLSAWNERRSVIGEKPEADTDEALFAFAQGDAEDTAAADA